MRVVCMYVTGWQDVGIWVIEGVLSLAVLFPVFRLEAGWSVRSRSRRFWVISLFVVVGVCGMGGFCSFERRSLRCRIWGGGGCVLWNTSFPKAGSIAKS